MKAVLGHNKPYQIQALTHRIPEQSVPPVESCRMSPRHPIWSPTKAQIMEKRNAGRFPNFLERAESTMPPYFLIS